MKKVKSDMVISPRPTGLPKSERVSVNAEYEIGETIEAVKRNINRARSIIFRNNIHSAELKLAVIMNIGTAFNHRNDPQWFDADYSFNDFLRENKIAEKTARDYEKYYVGLRFYQSLGINILNQPIRNIKKITANSFIETIKSDKNSLQEILSDNVIDTRKINQFKSKEKSHACDNSPLFRFKLTPQGIFLFFEPKAKARIVQILSQYGDQLPE